MRIALNHASRFEGATTAQASQSRKFIGSEVQGAERTIATTIGLNAGMAAQVGLLANIVQEAKMLDDDALPQQMKAAMWGKMSPQVNRIVTSVNQHLSLALGTLHLAAGVIERSRPIWSDDTTR